MDNQQPKPERGHHGHAGLDEPRKPRSDGEQSRERLLMAAIRLFAERGFASTSTRDIALAAGTNVAAISYYFGDKAGLYRATFAEQQTDPLINIALFDQPHFTLRQSLEGFYAQLLAPMQQGDMAQSCMRLWFREMLEPTGLWAEEIDLRIKPEHLALAALLRRHLGPAIDEDDLHRLTFAIGALAIQIMLGRDIIVSVRPQLLASSPAIEQWVARLVGYGEALVAAEQTRILKGAA